jgi:putative hydrolase of the HAD superfamily
MAARVVFWDFDGTLAWRPGMWSGCILEVLDERVPGHRGSIDDVRLALADGFPWHRHTVAHPELSDPEAWWTELTPLIEGAITQCGVETHRASELARAVRARFTDGAGWRLFDDVRPALGMTAAAGWQNVVVSNHVPELPRLVEHLGLDALVDRVFNSARLGFEKPHPELFRLALRTCGEPEERWMVGDNPVADVAGAEAVGIPAILVRGAGPAKHSAPDLVAAARLITGARERE